MPTKFLSFFVLFLSVFASCKGQTTARQQVDTAKASTTLPNYNYVIEAPEGWTIRDTSLNGLKIRFLFPPPSLRADLPTGNIVIAGMEGRNLIDFTTRNIDYLKSNLPGTVILERGDIKSSAYKGQWFTYTKNQNGVARDMINYIIPLNGYAYMITCGCNKGNMDKYRAIFDKIAESFKG